MLLAIGARFAENGCFYVFTVFVLPYATIWLELPKASVLNSVLVASGVQFVFIPLFGVLSDRCGRRPVYIGGAISLCVFAFPFFWLVDTTNGAMITLAVVLGLIIHAAMYAPQAAFFSELFGGSMSVTPARLWATSWLRHWQADWCH